MISRGFAGAGVMDRCGARGRGEFTDDLGQMLDGWLQTPSVYDSHPTDSRGVQREADTAHAMVHVPPQIFSFW